MLLQWQAEKARMGLPRGETILNSPLMHPLSLQVAALPRRTLQLTKWRVGSYSHYQSTSAEPQLPAQFCLQP